MELNYVFDRKAPKVSSSEESLKKRLDFKFIEAGQLAKFSDRQKEMFKALCLLRRQLAIEDDVPAYQVFGNQMIISICKEEPRDLIALARIDGMSPSKLRAYGDFIVDVLHRTM